VEIPSHGWIAIAALTRLEWLDASNDSPGVKPSPVTEMVCMHSLTNLQRLNLRRRVTSGIDVLPSIGKLTKLQWLDINYVVDTIDDKGLSHILLLTNLRHLDFKHHSASDKSLIGITKLCHLMQLNIDLSYALTSSGASYITQLTNLIKLKLHALSGMAEWGLKAIRAMPGLVTPKIIYLPLTTEEPMDAEEAL
jgi:hypothetical protein